MRALRISMILVALAVIASSCGSTPKPVAAPPRSTPTPTPVAAPPRSTPTPAPTAVPPTSTPTPAPTAAPPASTPTPTPTAAPPASTPTPAPTTAPPASIDREGLVAYWPFDGDANDASGNGHHGTVHGATLTADRNGEERRAYAFDGVDDFISVPDSPDFDIGDDDMTVLAWVVYEGDESRRGLNFYGLASHTDGVDARDGWVWTLGWGTGHMLVGMDNREHVYTSKIPMDAWVHLAFAKSGSEIAFYVDGKASGSTVDHGRKINDSDGSLRIGMEGSTYGEWFYVGKIDELAFYNRALTADEILAAMNAPQAGPMFTLATSMTEIIGTWFSAGKSVYLRFYEDGTLHQSHSLDRLDNEPYSKSQVWFEGTQMFLKETAVSGVPPCGEPPAIYEVRLLPEGRIQIVKILEKCAPRAGDTALEYEPVR